MNIQSFENQQIESPHPFPVTLNEAIQNNQFLKQVEAQEQQEIQLQMLTQQCQEMINKIFSTSIQVQESFLQTDHQEDSTSTLKQDKSRLEKQFLDLCVQIQRQQKQLENYKFKIKVANKEAQYYSRQIKQKQQILKNLQKHQQEHSTRRKSFIRK